MPYPLLHTPSVLNGDRINVWIEDVKGSSNTILPLSKLSTEGYGPNGIKLRHTAKRAGLIESTGNVTKRRRIHMEVGAVARAPARPTLRSASSDPGQLPAFVLSGTWSNDMIRLPIPYNAPANV